MCRPRALSGRNTASSVPGGIFSRPPELDARALMARKQALDGNVNGRFNSSGVEGGIFAVDRSTAFGISAKDAADYMYANRPSVPGGIFSGSAGATSSPQAMGGLRTQAWTASDAAGGRSSNAYQVQEVHTRGNLRGVGLGPSPATRGGGGARAALSHDGAGATPSGRTRQSAGGTAEAGAFARFLQERSGGSGLPAPPPPQPPPSSRDRFLDAVEAAEERDQTDLEILSMLQVHADCALVVS